MAGRERARAGSVPVAVELEAAVDGARRASTRRAREALVPAAPLAQLAPTCARNVVDASGGSGCATAAQRAAPATAGAAPRARARPGTTSPAVAVALGAHPPLADRSGARAATARVGSASVAEDRDLLRLERRRGAASRTRRGRRARCRRSRTRLAHRGSTSPSPRAAPARSSAGTRRRRRAGSTSEMNDAGAMMLDVRAELAQLREDRDGDRLRVARRTSSATSRSFHVQRNWKIASDAIAGRPSGRISRRKMRISDAPSMRADSRMSFGIPMKKLRSRKIANGRPNAVWKRIEAEDGVEEAAACCRA